MDTKMYGFFLSFLVFILTAFFNKRYKCLPVIAFLIFMCVYSTRTEIGTDWPTYLKYFNNLDNREYVLGRGFEPGYWLLNFCFFKMKCSYWNLVTCIGIFVCIIFILVAIKNHVNYGLFFLLGFYYYFYPSLESIRASISIVLFYYSLNNIDLSEKKYLIINFVGCMFHSSGAIAFLYYFYHKFPKVKKIICIGSFLMTLYISEPISVKIMSYLPINIYKRYIYYFGESLNKQWTDVISLKLMEYCLLLIVLIYINDREKCTTNYCYMEVKKKYSNSIKIVNLIELLQIGILIMICMGKISDVAYRFTYYTDIGVMLTYSKIYDSIKDINFKIIYVFMLIIYVCIRVYRQGIFC